MTKVNLFKEFKSDCLHIADMVTAITSSATNTILVIWVLSVGAVAQSASGIIILVLRSILGKFIINKADWAYNKLNILLRVDAIMAIATLVLTLITEGSPISYFIYAIVIVPISKLEDIAINRIYRIRYKDPKVREVRDNVRSALSDISSLIGCVVGFLFSCINASPIIMLTILMGGGVLNNIWYRKAWKESKRLDGDKKNMAA